MGPKNDSGGRSTAIAATALLVAAAVVWIWFRLRTGIVLEDALITFRYARNLALGEGLVFNPGEHVLGTTTPLLTLILGALGALLGPGRIPVISNVLMMAAGAGAGWLTFLGVRAIGAPPPAALLVTAAFTLHPDTIVAACGGMEAPLVLLLMAASFQALTRDRHLLAAAAAALLVLTRIDGAIWAIGVYAVILARDRRSFVRAILVGAAVAAPWFVFAASYFGSPIPHSVIAKRVLGAVPRPFGLEHLAAYLDWASRFLASAAPFGRVAGITLFVVGAAALLRKRPSPLSWLLVLYPVAFGAALYLGRSPLYFDWYLVPLAWASLIVGWHGLWRLGEWALRAGRRRAPSPRGTESTDGASAGRRTAAVERRPGVVAVRWAARAIVVAAAVAYAVLLVQQIHASAEFQRLYQENETGTRRAIGEWLARNTPAGAVVAMEAVGYQAWYSGRRVIDLGGLVSPPVVALRRESRSNAEAFERILREMKPDFLVLRSIEVDANRHYHGGPLFETDAQIAYFAYHYEEARRFRAPRTDLWGPTSYLTIYRRRSPAE